jgi:hypothetical protein
MSRYPASEFVGRLCDAGSQLGSQLRGVLDVRLRDYLATMPAVAPSPPNRYREWLARAFERTLIAHGDDGGRAAAHLLATPVIQQADHANLLLDPETLLNNYLFAVGCREAGVPIMLTSQCSTVSCIARRQPVAGPTFLRTRGCLYQVLPFSKRTLKDASFCALPGPVSLTFELRAGSWRADADPLLAPFVGQSAHGAPEAYRRANQALWRRLGIEDVTWVVVDESTTSETIATHLADPTSALTRLVLEPPVRDRFLRHKRAIVASPTNLAINRAAPDFFYYRSGSRLVPLVLRGEGAHATLELETTGAPCPVPLEAAALAEALRTGVIYGDRVLAYLARCLLPGVVAVGGTSQQDYVDCYRQMMLATHGDVAFLDADEVATLRRPDLSRIGGAALTELTGELARVVAELGRDARLADIDGLILDRTVGATLGTLACARYLEPRLSEVCR